MERHPACSDLYLWNQFPLKACFRSQTPFSFKKHTVERGIQCSIWIVLIRRDNGQWTYYWHVLLKTLGHFIMYSLETLFLETTPASVSTPKASIKSQILPSVTAFLYGLHHMNKDGAHHHVHSICFNDHKANCRKTTFKNVIYSWTIISSELGQLK